MIAYLLIDAGILAASWCYARLLETSDPYPWPRREQR